MGKRNLDSGPLMDSVIHASPEAIIALDSAGSVQIWNPAAERLLEWTKEEVIGRRIRLVSQEKKDAFLLLLEGARQGETFTGVETQRLKKDGSLADINFSAAPIYDEKGRISGCMGILADFSAQHQAEKALRESEKRFQDITENAAEWIWEVDSQGKYTFSSPVVEKLLG